MNDSVARIGAAFRVSLPWAWLIAIGALLGAVSAAALAARFSMLPAAVALALAAVATVVSLRWPLLSLGIFAAFIPIEEVLLVDGFGTLSRFAGVLFAVSYGLPRLGHLTFGVMPPAGWAYVSWALVSMGWAIDPDAGWAQLTTLLQLFLIAVLVAHFVVQRPEIVRPVLWVYSLSAAVTAVIGTQYYIAQGVASTRGVAIQGQDPAQFAAVLLPALVFGLYEMLNGGRRIAGGAVALLTTAGVLISGTRGAWVAVVIVLLLFVLPQLTPRRRVAAVVAVLAIGAIVYQLPGASDLISERTGNALSTGGAGRTDIWSVAGTIYGSAPVLGVGYANFPAAYTAEAVAAAGITKFRLEGRAPHNAFIGTLIELGPLGVLLLGLFLGPLVLRGGWGPDAAAIQAALASLLTLALFLDILANRKQVWLLIGLAAGLAFLARRNRMTQASSSSLLNGTLLPPGSIAIPDELAREGKH